LTGKAGSVTLPPTKEVNMQVKFAIIEDADKVSEALADRLGELRFKMEAVKDGLYSLQGVMTPQLFDPVASSTILTKIKNEQIKILNVMDSISETLESMIPNEQTPNREDEEQAIVQPQVGVNMGKVGELINQMKELQEVRDSLSPEGVEIESDS